MTFTLISQILFILPFNENLTPNLPSKKNDVSNSHISHEGHEKDHYVAEGHGRNNGGRDFHDKKFCT